MLRIQDLTRKQLQQVISVLKNHGIGINSYSVHGNFLYLHRDLVSHGQVFMIDDIHMKSAESSIINVALHLFLRVNNYRINELYGIE